MHSRSLQFVTLFTALLTPSLSAQTKGTVDPSQAFQMPVNIAGNSQVVAIMLPPSLVRKIFGVALSRTHAVVQIAIDNQNPSQEMIIKEVFIDYSDWGLSNCAPQRPTTPLPPNNVATKPCQVSSAELRTVRQIALEGQLDYWRNRLSRYMHGIATIGGGLANLHLGKDLPAAVAAFVGGPIPAFEFAFPDKTQGQVNLLNDLAYTVNKVVPKNSGVIVMAFFPIERFLGPKLTPYFLKAPSLLFSPQQYLLADKYADFFENIYDRIADCPDAPKTRPDKLNPHKNRCFERLIESLTLDRVRIVVDASYVVETQNVAAQITTVNVDDTWARACNAGEITGSIIGQFLTGEAVSITIDKAADLGINPATIPAGSTDTKLNFKFTLQKAVPPDTKLNFTVVKKLKDGTELKSNVFTPPTSLYTVETPSIQAVKVDNGTVTISGRFFCSLTADPTVQFTNGTNTVSATGITSTFSTLTFAKPAALSAGPWKVTVGTANATVSTSTTIQ